MKTFKVDELHHRMRADVFLATQYPQFARSALAKLFTADMVQINGVPEKAGYKLREGEKMTVDDSWLVETEVEDITLPIIYEDDDVLVIDKPAGVLSHSRGGLTREASVASFLRKHVDGLGTGDRAGIVHRLDRVTSGVMICAKNEPTMKFLQKQFQDRKVHKTYVAVTDKAPKHMKAMIDAPIGRDQNTPKQFHVDPHGKASSTKYEVKPLKNGKYLWELTPLTGRTHQLRVHLKYLGCPIIGDELYEGTPADRLYLHANLLELKLPSGKPGKFVSALPKGFSK
ncbi:MAG: RluA family pseudouridine synthase [Patescibacteria group bacterium]